MNLRLGILALAGALLGGCDSRRPAPAPPPAPPAKTASIPAPAAGLSELAGRLAPFACNRQAARVRIDAHPDVPIQALVTVLDTLRQARFERPEFGRVSQPGAPPPGAEPAPDPAEEGSVRLPAVSAAARLEPDSEAVLVSLRRNGTLYDQEARPLPSAREFAEKLGARRPVVIRADRDAAWKPVALLLEACAQAKVHRLSLAAVDPAGRPTLLSIPLPRENEAAPCAHKAGPPIPRLVLTVAGAQPACRVDSVPACGLCSAALTPKAGAPGFLVERPDDLSFGDDPEVEKPVFRTPSDHNETEADDWMNAKTGGELGDPAVGGPAPGPYARRSESRKSLVARGGGSAGTENAVFLALRWLARHQDRVGRWTAAGYLEQCGKNGSEKGKRCEPHGLASTADSSGGDVEAALTGLAALAFLGAGYTPASQDAPDDVVFGEVVRKAIDYLGKSQAPDGCIGAQPGRGSRHMLAHAIATLAVFECRAMTKESPPKPVLERALRFLCAGQARDGGWGYAADAAAGNAAVTAWALMALQAADLAGFRTDPKVHEAARAWLDKITEKTPEDSWRVRPQVGADTDAGAPAAPEGVRDHATAAAIGALSRILIDRRRDDPRVADVAAGLVKDAPSAEKGAVDYTHWHFTALAVFLHDAPAGPDWKDWNVGMAFTLIQSQRRDDAGGLNGSWEPVDRWSSLWGRVYATAINALTLESYYRIPPVAGR